MEHSTSQEFSAADAAYSPQVINEQDPDPMQAEQTTNQGNGNANANGNLHSATTSPPLDQDPNSRYNSPNLGYQPSSRPGSGMGHRSSQQANKSSVVIKVGMVGDAQIGKTSLMVKYVEGSWDEDYIQTLGITRKGPVVKLEKTNICRGKFHGEDNLYTQY
jgi:hypothetical protein